MSLPEQNFSVGEWFVNGILILFASILLPMLTIAVHKGMFTTWEAFKLILEIVVTIALGLVVLILWREHTHESNSWRAG